MDLETLKKAQKEAFQMIENSFSNQKLSHAYIFEGDAGVMKLDAALFFAAKVLCHETVTPCMECKNCKRIINQTHPNLYTVKLKKSEIVKNDIKALQSEFSKTALEAGPKIYIIESAERMNAYAQNALLKFLEEPTSETYALLLSDDATHLLPTIQSRSQRIPFHPINEDLIEDALSQLGYEQHQSRLASRMRPTIEDAKALLDSTDLESLIDDVNTVYEAYADGKSLLIAFHETLDPVLNQKEMVDVLIDVFIHYQKDIIYGKINNRNHIVFADSINAIERIMERTTLKTLTKHLEKMLQIKIRQRNYINMRLAFDNLLIAMEKGDSHGT